MRQPPRTPERLEVLALSWPEVVAGTDLAALLVRTAPLLDGDVVAVTSKVVSKAEGRGSPGERGDLVPVEARRIIASRGEAVIAETRHGLVLAAAGVDASNTPPGTVLALPADPDRSARELREEVLRLTGRNVAVILTDTAGRAWRLGQTDIAIGCAGLRPLVDLHGTSDSHGNTLVVTQPAVADEIAGAADLVKGKTSGRPVAVVRGLSASVCPPGEHGPGARVLVRDADSDLFALGAREAALAAALRVDRVALAHFPLPTAAEPVPFEALLAGRDDVAVHVTRDPDAGPGWTVTVAVRREAGPEAMVEAGRLIERAHVVAAAYRLAPRPPDTADSAPPPGWLPVATASWIPASSVR